MKQSLYFIILLSVAGFMSSCATIVGGSKYNAKVIVVDHPNARIEYQGVYQGDGVATFPVKRKDANKFAIRISEDGCESQTTGFTKRKFRGWAFTGTLLGWTGNLNGFFIPWGVIVDGATGAWWKPDDNEKGVTKENYKKYVYRIDYENCAVKPTESESLKGKDKVDYLRELKKMLDEGVITQEEFEKEKKKVLEKN